MSYVVRFCSYCSLLLICTARTGPMSLPFFCLPPVFAQREREGERLRKTTPKSMGTSWCLLFCGCDLNRKAENMKHYQDNNHKRCNLKLHISFHFISDLRFEILWHGQIHTHTHVLVLSYHHPYPHPLTPTEGVDLAK